MPRSTWFKALLLLVALWAPLSQAETGWQPIQETIRKSDKDNRQYQAIRLDNGMVVLLVSDPQAVKSLSALVVPVGSLEDPEAYQGLAHYLEHMSLMGSKKYPQADSLAEYLKMHGGSHNASTAPYRTAFYLEVENDALPGAVDRLADAIAEPLLDKKYAERERNAVNAELTMARTRDGMRMAQVSAETINPAHPGSKFSGGNLETLSDKPGNPVQQALKDFHEKYYSANLMKAVIYRTGIPQRKRPCDGAYKVFDYGEWATWAVDIKTLEDFRRLVDAHDAVSISHHEPRYGDIEYTINLMDFDE